MELIVGSKEIFTNVPEMDLVEVLGTLIDNAVQACNKENHGLGLYNAKKIIQKWNGEIYVENEMVGNSNYLSFHVEL